MSTLTIVSWIVQNFHRPGTSARLKIWFGQDFVTAEGQHVLGGAVRSGSIYLDIACDLADTHELTIPTFSLPTTDDSSVRNVRATAVLFDAGGAFVRNLFTGWIIPSELAPTTPFAALNAWNNTPPPPPPPPEGITREQAVVLIREGLQAEPVNGTFSTNRTPRASGPKTLVDGQVLDDGSNWRLQTVGAVEIGDYNGQQHGSRIAVNDSTGRASLFAGGGPESVPTNEYAGVAAVCTQSTAEVMLQSTGYSHVYGNKTVTRLGDGVAEHNSTYIEIDDLNQRIKLMNLPTSDPHVANVLWKNGADLKVSAG